MEFETGFVCDITIHGLAHLKDKYQGNIVQDKFFFLASATNHRGTLKAIGPTGKNVWMTKEQIKSAKKIHMGLLDLISICEQPTFGFLEQTREVDEY
jgi:hypothetical protein